MLLKVLRVRVLVARGLLLLTESVLRGEMFKGIDVALTAITSREKWSGETSVRNHIL